MQMINNPHPLQDLLAEIVHFTRGGGHIRCEILPDLSYVDLILFRLLKTGGRTVSDLARVRHVTRQTMSKTVVDWAGRGIVRLVDNPRHKRARLVLLTEKGEALLGAANSCELQFVRRVDHCFDPRQVETAVAVIKRLHGVLHANRWRVR